MKMDFHFLFDNQIVLNIQHNVMDGHYRCLFMSRQGKIAEGKKCTQLKNSPVLFFITFLLIERKRDKHILKL